MCYLACGFEDVSVRPIRHVSHLLLLLTLSLYYSSRQNTSAGATQSAVQIALNEAQLTVYREAAYPSSISIFSFTRMQILLAPSLPPTCGGT